MKNKTLPILLIFFFIFIFIVFYNALNNSNIYTPNTYIKKDIPSFTARSFYSNNEFVSEIFFIKDEYYLLNIWASWCVPCRDEHSILMALSTNSKLKIIGLNYKDDIIKAKEFLKELGDPYSNIIIDKDGTKAIEWSAYGVPESFIIHENKILKKYIGPLNLKSLNEIKEFIK